MSAILPADCSFDLKRITDSDKNISNLASTDAKRSIDSDTKLLTYG